MIVLLTRKQGTENIVIGTCRVTTENNRVPVRITPINLPDHRRFELMGTMLSPSDFPQPKRGGEWIAKDEEVLFYQEQDFENIGHAEMIE